MITIIPSDARYTADHGWLKSRFSFSFAEYHDPQNHHFGAMRVFNDDIVQAGKGFGMHPHAEMEIISYVIEGTLQHHDSMGNTGLIEAGEVQRITAGTGIHHSEYNASNEKPVHFLQIWVLPNEKGLSPSWDQKAYSIEQQQNKLLPIVSGNNIVETISIHQDVTFYLSHLEAGKQIVHRQEPDRRILVFVIHGSVILNNTDLLQAGDSARITDLSELVLESSEGAHFLLADLNKVE